MLSLSIVCFSHQRDLAETHAVGQLADELLIDEDITLA
jgi:hypothetical protein